MPIELNLTDEKICETYPRLLQIDGTKLYDGLGNLIIDLADLVSGNPQAELAKSGSRIISLSPGTTDFIQIDKALYKGAFIDYVLYNDTSQRSGSIVITNNGTSVEFTEQSTKDIGNTDVIHLDSIINGDTFDVRVLGVPDDTYHLRYIYKYI